MLNTKDMKKDSKGVSLFLVILILSVLSTTLLSLIIISISQIKIIWSLGDSVVAFYAADTGVEQALYRTRQQENFANFSDSIGSASYEVTVTTSTQTIIRSVGTYKNRNRAIESRH
jgi:hypothetical protein